MVISKRAIMAVFISVIMALLMPGTVLAEESGPPIEPEDLKNKVYYTDAVPEDDEVIACPFNKDVNGGIIGVVAKENDLVFNGNLELFYEWDDYEVTGEARDYIISKGLDNNGRTVIAKEINVEACDGHAYGIYQIGGSTTADMLSVYAESMDAYGMYLDGGTSNIETIQAEAAQGNAYGVWLQDGSATVNDISATAVEGIATGVYIDGGVLTVNGVINADGDGYGIVIGAVPSTVTCTDEVKGGTAAIKFTGENIEQLGGIVVYSLESDAELPSGEKILVVDGDDGDITDTALQQINYIIKKNDRFGAISIKEGDTTKIGDYDTAHAGDVLTIRMAVGYTLGGTVTVTPNEDGSYTVIIPRGGAVTLDAILRQIAKGGGSSVVVTDATAYTKSELNQLGNKLGAYVINGPEELTREVCENNKKLVFTEAALKNIDFVNQFSFLLTNSEYTIYGVSNDGNVTETTNDGKGITTVSKGLMGEIGKQEPEGSGENSKPADNHIPTDSSVKVSEETKKAIAEAQEKASEYYGADNTGLKVNFKVEHENETDNTVAIEARKVRTVLSEGNVYSDKCSAILPNKSIMAILGDDQRLMLGAGGQTFEIAKEALIPSGGAATVRVSPEPSGKVTYTFGFVQKDSVIKANRIHGGVSQSSTINLSSEYVKHDNNSGTITVTAKLH